MLETHRAGKVPLKALDCRCTPGAVACADALSPGFSTGRSHPTTKIDNRIYLWVLLGLAASVDFLK